MGRIAGLANGYPAALFKRKRANAQYIAAIDFIVHQMRAVYIPNVRVYPANERYAAFQGLDCYTLA